ncbi:MAG TPA: ATP-binding cassette domain-containing protein [Syntrophomonadaceae bacterium]|nr:ATP-binding cassette domain-containing protein [Syntrophomonadaceae bacterium]HQA06964.1 ATP-binding cassette domain-containing protein [Syntrophomonadaceae bacterium]HQE23916.1 ATP-binding cassette domain-containing protein [Syntrophomonadaceae bacterium]
MPFTIGVHLAYNYEDPKLELNSMLVLQAQKLNKYYGDRQILNEVSFTLQKGERVGLVGVNGCGKSTLLKCLTGEVIPDSGEVWISAQCRVACLEQMPDYNPESTPWDIVMGAYSNLLQMRQDMRSMELAMEKEDQDLESIMNRYAQLTESYERANGFACETIARRILTGLGFAEQDFHRSIAGFSGGQKTRIVLARLLAEEPDILLLDEPTNHLDLTSLEWLEEFLLGYPGSILVVSHDRRFLDKVVTRILDLHQGRLDSYPGNYTDFMVQKQTRLQAMEKAYQKQQEEIRKTEEFIRRYKAGVKARQARGRQAQLQRMEKLERPSQNARIANWNLEVKVESGQDVLTISGLAKSYPGCHLFSGVDLLLRKGERAALIGPNGCGKSTLLKIIVGEETADEGQIRLGSKVQVGYFAQQHEGLNPELTVLDELIYNSDCTVEEARTLLGRMLFTGDDVFKKVKDLSGGERARLALLMMLLTSANFLVLDEPTNHMDMESRLVVEDMLSQFNGTLLVVSHDRSLIDALATRVLVFEKGGLASYTGNYSDYKDRQAQQRETVNNKDKNQEAFTDQQQYRHHQKEIQRMLTRMQREKEQAEAALAALEKRINEVERDLADPEFFADPDAAARLGKEYEELLEQYEQAFYNWEQLNQQWEEFNESQK